jgi:dihydroorotate dehydrogenase (fumarate)
MISDLAGQGHGKKPFIVSVTGSPQELAKAYQRISTFASHHKGIRLAMEINLSCPNIADTPPPAYDLEAFKEYLAPAAAAKVATYTSTELTTVALGVKLPPYTFMGQFKAALEAIKASKGNQYDSRHTAIDFVTTTNTLGSSLLLDEGGSALLASEAGTGIGGLAGAAIHPLSLGNVATLRRLFDADSQTKDIYIIGVGGVEDAAGYARMRAAGAGAVACASALGRYGVDVFRRISEE